MTVFYFAACLISTIEFEEGFKIARCQYVTQVECEAVFDECYPGWVATSVRRKDDE